MRRSRLMIWPPAAMSTLRTDQPTSMRSPRTEAVLQNALGATDLGRLGQTALASAAVTVSRAGANPPTVAELAAR